MNRRALRVGTAGCCTILLRVDAIDHTVLGRAVLVNEYARAHEGVASGSRGSVDSIHPSAWVSARPAARVRVGNTAFVAEVAGVAASREVGTRCQRPFTQYSARRRLVDENGADSDAPTNRRRWCQNRCGRASLFMKRKG
jgi:hypothetical protein